jgi:iron complex outermembrane receptor protein
MTTRLPGIRYSRGISLILTSIVSTWGSPVTAQTAADQTAAPAADQPAQPPSDSSTVQEIVVTATRRAVDLQSVSSTVEALPAGTLKSLDITNVLQLADVVPGLVVAPTGGNNLYLRGVGTTSAGYNEAQVAVYIDGLYLPNPAMGIYSFNNIDQVEVLKGPQGTLYGRNVTAGLISITTRDPGEAPRLDASIGYGNYDTRTENLYGSMPITDALAANIAVYNSKQNEGWGKNLFTGHQTQKSDETGVQAKLLWRPTSSTRVTTSFIYDTNNRDFGLNWQEVPGTIANDGTTSLGRYNSASRIDPSAPFTAYIGSVKIQQDLGFASLTSLSGYQTSRQHPLFTANTAQLGQPIARQGTVIDDFMESNRTWSQEFQLASKPSDSRLDWILGFFYYHDSTEIAASTHTTCVEAVCAPGYIPNTITGYPTTSSYSGFADANYRFFDATHLTLGLRYTDETKGLTGQEVPLSGFPNSIATLPSTIVAYPGQHYPGNPTGIPTTLHFDKLTYRVVLAQDFGPDVHAYVSDNLGFKSGAFNANLFSNPPVQPEVLYAYEAGLKSELFERKLRLNLAYFYYDYTNVQLRSTAPPAPAGSAFLENVAAEHERGVDGDFAFVPIGGLTINGGFEFLDAKYVRFPGTTCSSSGPTKMINGVLVGTVISVPCSLNGYDVALAVPLSASLGFVYNFETSYGSLALGANYHYNARHTLTPDGSIYAPKANLVDANLTWTAPNKHYDILLYVKNLTNVYTYANAAVSANSFAYVPGPPRIFGVTFGLHY